MLKFIKTEIEYRRMKKQIKNNNELIFNFNPLIDGIIESHIALLPKK